MEKHNDHELQDPAEALNDITRNKFAPEVKILLNRIEKGTNPFEVMTMIDEIHVVCDKAWHLVHKKFLGEDKTMKKLIMIAVAMVFMAGCFQERVSPTLKPQEVKITVSTDSDKTKAIKDTDKISKTMEVSNPELELSRYCKVKDGKAYFTITSISSWGAESLWSDLQLLELLKIKNIVVYLNNPGGEAWQGLSISDEIRMAQERGFHFLMDGRGVIMSAAVPVFVSGDKRIVSKNLIFLIHPARMFKWGMFTEGMKELKSQAKMLELLESRYAEIISSRTNLSKEKIIEMNRVDTWFTAEEAKEWGFVDEVK